MSSAPERADGLVVMLNAAGLTIARLEAENAQLRAANAAALAELERAAGRHRAHPPTG